MNYFTLNKSFIQIFIIFLYFNISFSQNVNISIGEDGNLLVPDLLLKYGYPSETHFVVTEDNYVLTIHRIPRPGAQPVFLQHGILDSSVTWIIMGTRVGLGYMLYDLGYDVWMGNVRGNRYSRNHTNFSVDKNDFWKFSWHEIGLYDLPAMIDHVLNKTQYKKLHYIGHSQGTTAFWVMTSRRPEYNKKILLMQALAPVAYMDGSESPVINLLVRILGTAEAMVDLIGFNEFSPSKEFVKKAGYAFCHEETVTQAICTNILFLLCGYNSEQLNKKMLPVVLSHYPAGASVKQFIHYGQLGRSETFSQYDYGHSKNFQHYGSSKPPLYDLDRITAPIIFHYSKNDWVTGWKSVERFHKQLKNSNFKIRYLVPNPKFNHLDFVWAKDVRKLLYNRVVKLLKRFDGKK